MKKFMLFIITMYGVVLHVSHAKAESIATQTPYKNCSDVISQKILTQLKSSYAFKQKEKDCLIIDDQKALFAVALPVEQNQPDSPYLLRIYLFDYTVPKQLAMRQKQDTLYSSYQDFDGIFFDLVHFSTLTNKHVIGLRHQWSSYKPQTNSGNEYLELIEIQPDTKLRFVLNDLPTKSHYYSRGECPTTQAKWGANIHSVIVLGTKQHNGLQDLVFKQIYTHNEAHQATGCKQQKGTQQFKFSLPFDGQKYQYDPDEIMQIDVI